MAFPLEKCKYTAYDEVGTAFFVVLRDLVRDPTSTNKTTRNACREINEISKPFPKPVIASWNGGKDGRHVSNEIWHEFFSIAQQIPHENVHAQETLARFVIELRDVPDDEDEKWRKLNYMGWEADDACSDAGSRTVKQRNLHAFVARLTRDGTQDFTTWALCSLRFLESIPDYRARAFHTQGPALDAGMPLAAQWMSLTGEHIYRNDNWCSRQKDGGNLWQRYKKQLVLYTSRWKMWKTRFDEVSRFHQVTEETRGIAKRTYELMVSIEASVKSEELEDEMHVLDMPQESI